jgi:ferric-dicitrate binding protein FerR (iron transport regulator)
MVGLFQKLRSGFLRPLLVLCTSLILVYQPAAGLATPIAVGQISSSKGAAEINGVRAVKGGTVFSGDRIDTERNATASVSLTAGRQVILVAASSLQIALTGSQVTGTLEHGEVAVLSPASDPTVIEAGGTRIVPGKGGSVYTVELNNNKLNVTASRGTVLVEAADRTVEVPEGKTLEAALDPAQGPSGSGSPSASGSSSHFVTVLVVSAAALAVATVTLLVRDLSTGCKVVSPSTAGQCDVTH